MGRNRDERIMTRCAFGCIHCGKCGPASREGMVQRRPLGYCVFCGIQNGANDVVCASCGKPLPRMPGVGLDTLGGSAMESGGP